MAKKKYIVGKHRGFFFDHRQFRSFKQTAGVPFNTFFGSKSQLQALLHYKCNNIDSLIGVIYIILQVPPESIERAAGLLFFDKLSRTKLQKINGKKVS